MRLIDDAPGFFLTLCFVVVYAVVGVEAAMWMSSSIVLVALTFVLIAFVAGAICAWMVRLLGDGAPIATVQAVTRREAAPGGRARRGRGARRAPGAATVRASRAHLNTPAPQPSVPRRRQAAAGTRWLRRARA